MSQDTIRKLLSEGRYVDALGVADAALRRSADDYNSLFLKAVCQAQLGDPDAARQSLTAALLMNPRPPWTWKLMGLNLTRDAGSLEEAAALGAQIVATHPEPEAFNAYGLTLRALRRTTDIDQFHRAITLRPSYTVARINLAQSLKERGDLQAASTALEDGLALDATAIDLQIALARLREATGDDDAAKLIYERANRISGNSSFEALWRYGRLAQRLQDLFTAISAFEQALVLDRQDVELWVWLGNCYLDVGAATRASYCFQEALKLRPSYTEVYDNLLLSYHYHDSLDATSMLAAHQEWNRRYMVADLRQAHRSELRPRGRRRLRLGFASFDLSRPAMQAFLVPLLASLDKTRFVLVGVDAVHAPQVGISEIRDLFDDYHEVHESVDERLADYVRTLDLDVLIDLDGHVPGNRLRAWGQRVAPRQVTWLDYFDTTGVPAMDYLLGDDISTPSGTTQQFTEKVLTLGQCRLCYAPPTYIPEVAPPPVARTGFITFGSFNRISKLNEATVDRWASLMREVPASRLILKSSVFESATTTRTVAQRFVTRGIGEERLHLRPRSVHADMLAEYRDIDIALDTHPYNGGLTTCEALYMGVPVVGLRGSSMISLQTVALLSAAGLSHWIAEDIEAWRRINLMLVTRPNDLYDWRTNCRRHLKASRLLDRAAFATAFSALMRRTVEDLSV